MSRHDEEISLKRFAKLVGRPRWVIEGWCTEALIRGARLTSNLRYRIHTNAAHCYASGAWQLPDGDPPNATKRKTLKILGEASLLLVKSLPEKQRKELIKVIDRSSKQLRRP